MGKRAYSITTGETSVIMWGIGFLMFVFAIINLVNIQGFLGSYNTAIGSTIGMIILLLIVSIIFSLIGLVIPNYAITKWNVNVLIDRITNPDFIGWLRFTRNKSLRLHTVQSGALGQTKSMADGKKASVINNGDYTITLPNGNKAIITNDLLSQNDNLIENVGWNLVSKHFGVFGFDAYTKAVEKGRLLFKIKDEEKDVLEREEI